ncbi:unnamed protein product [Clavelina lepadiformis]|uniref:HECT-type E3 ubiquitin transferase n=1 Tax=Clavelina lepadiformis TaxID=159417 RepID=A0ABP0GGP7_CLALP
MSEDDDSLPSFSQSSNAQSSSVSGPQQFNAPVDVPSILINDSDNEDIIVGAINDKISGDPSHSDGAVISSLMEKLRSIMRHDEEEPCQILRLYQSLFLQGRQLDADETMAVEDGEGSHIFVSRANPLETAAEEMLGLENIRFPLCVQFYGETALDTGGPRRDFFRIMIQAMMEKNIFEEKENNVTLCKNESLVHKQWYYVCGLVVGLSCLEGGDNIHLKEELLTEIGTDIYTKQFQQGLCKCGIMKLLTAFPVLKYIWTNPANRIVTVGKLLNNFKVNFSPEGSNSRKDEERAYSIFVSYVREVAGAGRKDFISINLQSILAYITGNSSIPVLGFNPLATISFQADNGAFLPQAHTCINQFVLSRVQHGANPETVKRGLDWAFSSMDFGAENV